MIEIKPFENPNGDQQTAKCAVRTRSLLSSTQVMGDKTWTKRDWNRGKFMDQDLEAWSIPKGLIAEDETPLAAAKREFAEDRSPSARQAVPLGESKQPGGKIVHVWAVEGGWGGAAGLKSSMFELEWPPRSGRRQKFPELDRAEWFGINQAHTKILKGQTVFFDRLLAVIVNS